MKSSVAVFNLSQKFKNLNRFRTISNIFAQHGFITMLEILKIDQIFSRTEDHEGITAPADVKGSGPYRLRKAFEELGPTFVKLGQMLSTREDLIPLEYVTELTKLQDNVPAFDTEKAKQIILEEMGAPVSELFKDFSPTPIAAASIGQVHRATLHNGSLVVLKIQRPDIERIIQTDISILYAVAHILEKVPEFAFIHPVQLIQELDKTFRHELDFLKEARNTERFYTNFEDVEDIIIPRVYWDLISKRLLTTEFIDGKSLAKIQRQEQVEQYDFFSISKICLDSLFKQILVDGFFHGDFHDGNILITSTSSVALVDFGIVGRLHPTVKSALGNMFIALVAENYDEIISEFLEIADLPMHFNRDKFQVEVQELLEPYYDQPLAEINFGSIIMGLAKISAKHQAIAPRELILLAKTFTSVESFAKRLNPELNIIQEGDRLARSLLTSYMDPDRLLQNSLLMGKDLSVLMKILPKQLKIFTQALNSGKVQVQVNDPHHRKNSRLTRQTRRDMSLSIILSALFIGSPLLLQTSSPYLIYGKPLHWIMGMTGLSLGFSLLLVWIFRWVRQTLRNRKEIKS